MVFCAMIEVGCFFLRSRFVFVPCIISTQRVPATVRCLLKTKLCYFCVHTESPSVTAEDRARDDDAFQCPSCPVMVTSLLDLTEHLRVHGRRILTDIESSFLCPFCVHTSTSITHLATHIEAHIVEKPFACKHCSYASSSRSDLLQHLLVHGINAPHVSGITASISKAEAVPLVQSGIDVKEYTCSHCLYRSDRKWCVDRHFAATHCDERKQVPARAPPKQAFVCAQCPFTTPRRWDFNRHLRVHTKAATTEARRRSSGSSKHAAACTQCAYTTERKRD